MNDFTHEIYSWFLQNKRDLPWRKTNDPYKIWISEIILQQTRVAQGINYYKRFIESFPTITDLANAKEDEVLKKWQGLGYYSRARNLHFTAKTILKEYKGKFPQKYNIILSLKGIGPYTAAAISSIAFNQSYPVVDGNIYRLFSRYWGIETPIDSAVGKKEFQQLAEQIMPKQNCGFHNQALMEFGALQCTPKSPACSMCPVQTGCYAFKNKAINKLPIKSKKLKQRKRFFYFFLIENKDCIILEKRTENDIWKNLHQFPLYESEKELNDKALLKLKHPAFKKISGNLISVSSVKKHILSHQIIFARLIRIEINGTAHINKPFIPINRKDIFKFAVPRLLELFMEDYDLGIKKIK